jgi:hypothetical protein
MKTEEFNLSEKQLILITKIIDASARNSYAEVGDYLSQIINNEKEFIKRLKERFCEDGEFREENEKSFKRKCHNCQFIDKLAGEKLIIN